MLDAAGREWLVITGGKGDQGLRRLIAYLRNKRRKLDPVLSNGGAETKEAA